jgi:exodeoxyribonuclease III
MRVININLNGIRSAAKKGFFEWLKTIDADFICMQETRAQLNKGEDGLFRPEGYFSYFVDAEKKGYSGVGIYSKHQPKNVSLSLGWNLPDQEGRYIHLDFTDFTIASLYVPSGTSGEHRQEIKFDFLRRLKAILDKKLHEKKHVIIAGDINIAHKQIDIKNWRANQKHSGFLPEERAWMDEIIEKLGWVDAFRAINKSENQYTWWSNFGRAWEKNVGWRIDYQLITPNLKSKVTSATIYKEARFSDHAPVIIDYDFVP